MVEVGLHQLTRQFPGGITALDDVSLRVAAGESLVLLGPSGSGKTTTLRLIAGLETPSRGRVTLDGVDASGLPPHRRQIGYLAQRPVLYPHRSVGDNLRFGLSSAPEPHLEDQIVRALGLADLLDRRPDSLSGGQQQRVALGRALLRRPRLLLLDEPLNSLDPPLRWELARELHLLRRRLSATMVAVTHEQDDALTLADRLAILQSGRLVQVGTPGELLAHPATILVARLVGWPPVNLLAGELVQQDDGLVLRGKNATLPIGREWRDVGGRPVVLGIRPDALRLPVPVPEATGEVVVSMRLAAVQPGEATSLATVELGSWSMTARRIDPLHGTTVPVALRQDSLLLFDAGTGQLLRS